MGPNDFAFEVHSVESQATEVTIDKFAISDRGLGGVGILEVNRGFGLPFVNVFIPEYFARVEVEADHFPKVSRLGDFETVSAKVESLFRALAFPFVDNSR